MDEPIAMVRNSQNYFYHFDGLGSVTGITDTNGTAVQRYGYDSFGNIVSMLDPNFKQPYSYTSREYDEETGLYYYRARYYDSASGRFIGEDPIGFLGGVNLYAYVENNAVNFVDPQGLEMLLLERQPFIFRYPGVNRLAPNQRYVQPRTIPRPTAPRTCEPAPQPMPSPVPKPSWWGRFLKDLADLLDELGLGSKPTPTLPYDPYINIET